MPPVQNMLNDVKLQIYAQRKLFLFLSILPMTGASVPSQWPSFILPSCKRARVLGRHAPKSPTRARLLDFCGRRGRRFRHLGHSSTWQVCSLEWAGGLVCLHLQMTLNSAANLVFHPPASLGLSMDGVVYLVATIVCEGWQTKET